MAEVVVIGAGIVGLVSRLPPACRRPQGDRARPRSQWRQGVFRQCRRDRHQRDRAGIGARLGMARAGLAARSAGAIVRALATLARPAALAVALYASGNPAEVERITSGSGCARGQMFRRSRPVAGDARAVGRPAPGRCPTVYETTAGFVRDSAGMGSQAPTRHPRRGDHRRPGARARAGARATREACDIDAAMGSCVRSPGDHRPTSPMAEGAGVAVRRGEASGRRAGCCG